MVAKALEIIMPTSPFWILRPELLEKAVTVANQPAKYKDYVQTAVSRFPTDIKLVAIGTAFFNAFNANEMEKAQTYLARLLREYPDDPTTTFFRQLMDKDKKVSVGKSVPAFIAPSFDDPKLVYTNTNIKAKVYLLDFWATWCLPCIEEIPKYYRSYEKFHDKGFEILSYSFDSNREVVINFRKRNAAPMPWLHAIDPRLRGMNDEIVNQFEIIGIPSVFLVDSNGIILATHFDLVGDNLEKILTKTLGVARN